MRNLISPLKPIGENKRNFSNIFHGQTRRLYMKGTKISTLVFQGKYYLVGPKIILMVLYSIFLQSDNSSFPPLG